MKRRKNQSLTSFIKMLGTSQDKRLYELAAVLKMSPQNFSRKLLTNNLKYEEAEILADLLNYEIVWSEKENRI